MKKKHRPSPQSKQSPVDPCLLSIVILVHGRFDLLKKCLDALPAAANGIEYKLVLVDNASPDQAEADAFYKQYSNASVLRNKKNVGFPAGCNQGARRYDTPLLLMLNSDVVLQPEAIDYLVRGLDNPKVGVVGAKLLFPDLEQASEARLNTQIRPAGKVQHIGLETNIRGEFYHIFMGWSPEHTKVNAMRDTYAVTGACLLTRRNLWNKIGGFDEAYGTGTYEDVSFCLSARELGFGVIVEPKAVGVHYTGATAEGYRIPYPLNFNRLIFMQRWGNKLNYTEPFRL